MRIVSFTPPQALAPDEVDGTHHGWAQGTFEGATGAPTVSSASRASWATKPRLDDGVVTVDGVPWQHVNLARRVERARFCCLSCSRRWIALCQAIGTHEVLIHLVLGRGAGLDDAGTATVAILLCRLPALAISGTRERRKNLSRRLSRRLRSRARALATARAKDVTFESRTAPAAELRARDHGQVRGLHGARRAKRQSMSGAGCPSSSRAIWTATRRSTAISGGSGSSSPVGRHKCKQ